MPARRLDEHESAAVKRRDVAGLDSDTQPEFVSHVGLFEEDADDVWLGSWTSLSHMMPPLELNSDEVPIQSVGDVPLTSDQRDLVGCFIEDRSLEYQSNQARKDEQYISCPHALPQSVKFPYQRFNCGGFVIEAYREAGIDLIAARAPELPFVTLEVLIQAYPSEAGTLQRPKLRALTGLVGDGPWQVVFAGYVLNALDRTKAQITAAPYLPVAGDEFFPPRRP
ncbi:MAG: hypothetical protein N2C14_00830, partial [Planctomycetales bacterium]